MAFSYIFGIGKNREKLLRIEDPRRGERPTPLQKVRKRALTLPLQGPESFERQVELERLPSQWQLFCSALRNLQPEPKGVEKEEVTQITIDQEQSILFRLPIEIRQMIWREALGNGVVHITHLKNRLGHVRCICEDEGKWETNIHDCWGRGCRVSGSRATPAIYTAPVYWFKEPESLLGLLKTCRVIYSEAIEFLYSANSFDVRHLYTISDFCSTVRRCRVDQITSLQLTWDISYLDLYNPHHLFYAPEDQETWKEAWNFISRFKGLRILRVQLHGDYETFNPANWPSSGRKFKILEALCVVKQTEVFEVKVPWSAKSMETAGLVDAMPFRLEGVKMAMSEAK